MDEPSYKGRKDFSDLEMAMVVFSFLFASQDAMSSGLIYGFQHLADHPEIYRKVLEEHCWCAVRLRSDLRGAEGKSKERAELVNMLHGKDKERRYVQWYQS